MPGWRGLVLGAPLLLLGLCTPDTGHTVTPPSAFVQFDGTSSYIEVPESPDFSVATSGALTVAAWIRPDTLTFPSTEGSGYVHWLGKGAAGQQEWTFRIYSQDNQENRANRISFYVFNAAGGLGIGSHFEDPVTPGQWMHVVGSADGHQTRIFKNGVQRDCDQYTADGESRCNRYAPNLWITPHSGNAPLRIGTRDLHSFFQGALAQVRVWSRALSGDEVANLYTQDVAPRDSLIAEYLFEEGSGTIAHDTAGAHHGTLFGATWSTQH